MTTAAETIETRIPARMDRLPWSRWHWLVVAALGITWILDGFEVTVVGAVAAVLTNKDTIGLTDFQVGFAGSMYLAGAITGALLFGYLTDRLGRKKLFMITLGIYLVGTVLTAVLTFNFWTFWLFRFITGLGIGGEYAAINSAIDELIPARVRGWVALTVNGSWWLGTAAGAALSIVLLNPDLVPVEYGWRIAFGLGAILAVAVIFIRRALPESPRWLMTHGRAEEAERVVDSIEEDVKRSSGESELHAPSDTIEVVQRESIGFGLIARTLVREYPSRAAVGFALNASQAFLYNAIFFTYALVLTSFYDVAEGSVGYYLLPFAAGNFLGPLLLGPLFDRIGRRVMISLSYAAAGVLLLITGLLFQQEALSATSQTICWSVIFFFASAAGSSALLTVSEVFPLEIRAMAIAFFYAVATGLGGFVGPLLFGALIATNNRTNLFIGYAIAAVLVIIAAVVELIWGVAAEQKPLEKVAKPLSELQAEEEGGQPDEEREPEPRRRRWRAEPRTTYGSMWAPRSLYSSTGGEYADREVELIEHALSEQETASREELAAAVGARHWGPGRFRRALRLAIARGRVRPAGRNGYELAGRRPTPV
jgi:MFS family permease